MEFLALMKFPLYQTSPGKGPLAHRPESPTTARELDFDDEPQETGVAGSGHPGGGTVESEEVAPPKPPRPLNPRQEAENTLREAFPTIDAAVVKAVLTASGGQVEPAFNALLGALVSLQHHGYEPALIVGWYRHVRSRFTKRAYTSTPASSTCPKIGRRHIHRPESA